MHTTSSFDPSGLETCWNTLNKIHCFTLLLKTYEMFDFEKKHKQFAISLYRYAEIPFCFRLKTWSYCIVHYRQYSDRRKASFKLSNATICPQCSILWCLVRPCHWQCIMGGWNFNQSINQSINLCILGGLFGVWHWQWRPQTMNEWMNEWIRVFI